MHSLNVALEVMDKEPSLGAIWLTFLLLGALGYLGSKNLPWLVAPALVAIAVATWVLLQDLLDPFVGPAMIVEAGWGYVILSGVAALAAAVMTIAGYRSRKRAA
jgi:hypothetical protein